MATSSRFASAPSSRLSFAPPHRSPSPFADPVFHAAIRSDSGQPPPPHDRGRHLPLLAPTSPARPHRTVAASTVYELAEFSTSTPTALAAQAAPPSPLRAPDLAAAASGARTVTRSVDSSLFGASAVATTTTTTAAMSLAHTDLILARVVASQQCLAKQMKLTAAAVAQIADYQAFESEEGMFCRGDQIGRSVSVPKDNKGFQESFGQHGLLRDGSVMLSDNWKGILGAKPIDPVNTRLQSWEVGKKKKNEVAIYGQRSTATHDFLMEDSSLIWMSKIKGLNYPLPDKNQPRIRQIESDEDKDVQLIGGDADKKLDVEQGVAQGECIAEKETRSTGSYVTNDVSVAAENDYKKKVNDEIVSVYLESDCSLEEKVVGLVTDNFDFKIGMEQVHSLFEVKGVVGNIIQAVATTNAIIAGSDNSLVWTVLGIGDTTDLDPKEKVFQVRFTKEIFQDYQEYPNRLNLYRAAEKAQQLRRELVAPVLHMVQYSTLSLTDLVNKIYGNMQEDLFEGLELHAKIDGSEAACKILKVIECILSFFCEAGIPFNAVCQESFQLMLEAIGRFGPGLRGPSPEELRGPFLQEQVSAINDLIEVLKNLCVWKGCSIMLEDIGNIALINNTVAKARSITAFIYGHTRLLDRMHEFTKEWDLIQIGITQSTTSYLNLKSLYDKKIELKTMFISKEWEDGKWSTEAVGKKFYNLVVSNKFWHRVLYAINIFEPLVYVLRRMGSGILSMGYICGDLANANKEIALRFGNKEKLDVKLTIL